MKIHMIAAMASNRVIGKDNTLPRKYPADLQYFKKITTEQIIVMGRATFASLGKPLPKRRNIVLSKSPLEGVESYQNIEAMIKQLTSESIRQIFIIGGANTFRQFLPIADSIYLTEIKKAYDGDTSFPEFESEFNEVKREVNDEMDFVVYERKS